MTEEEIKSIAETECKKLLKSEKGYNGISFQEFWAEGYMKCLAEGWKEKWHDLRKNPDDLPKEDCETVTLHENGNKNIIKWKRGEWTDAIVVPVIAWCELPQFKE